MEALSRLPFKLPICLQSPQSWTLPRSILRVHGPDALKFLQGLTTNDLNQIKESSGQYTTLLNPQGRMMYDGFVWRAGAAEFLLEADARIGKDLYYHLKQFQLRSQLTITDVSAEWTVNSGNSHIDGEMQIVDPRGDLGLTRAIKNVSQNQAENDWSGYAMLLYSMGIPEGPLQIPRGQAIPLEYGIDLLGGISFSKGCYLGQELVARTHHRGVIRKRLVPTMILEEKDGGFQVGGEAEKYKELVDEDVSHGNESKSSGRIVSTMGNLCMALLRLEGWTLGDKFSIPGRSIQVEPYRPPWWKNN